MINMLKAAKAAKPEISRLTTDQKNAALEAMADALLKQQDAILLANQADMEKAAATISTAPVTPSSAGWNRTRTFWGSFFPLSSSAAVSSMAIWAS